MRMTWRGVAPASAALALLLALALTLGAAWPGVAAAEPPKVSPEGRRPTVALVLGGGAARGISHLGLIQALEENGVPIDFVVGTSMGSIVGGLYAAGYSPSDMRQIVQELDYARLFALQLPPRGGLLFSDAFAAFLDTLLEGRDFSQLRLPFYAVLTKLSDGTEVPLHAGPVSRAVLASMTIPVLFPPVEIAGDHFVDGGMKNAVPANVARDLGADLVLAVDVKKELAQVDYGSLLNVFQLTMYFMIDGYVQKIAPLADVVIVPEAQYDSYMEYGRTEYFFRKGYEAAQQALPAIRAAIARQAPGFPYFCVPPTPDHPPAELQALLDRAYRNAQAAPRPFSLYPVFRPQAGSEPRLALGLEGGGGGLGRWRGAVGYRWNLADPAADYAALSLNRPLGPRWTGQAYFKRYPKDGATRPGAALVWRKPPDWAGGLAVETPPGDTTLRWRAEVGRERPITGRLALDWHLSAGRLPPGEAPGRGAPGVTGDSGFTAARLGLTYSPTPDGWPVWELALAQPRLLLQVETVAWVPGPSSGPSTETWLRTGGRLDLKFFGFLPLQLRLLAGTAVPTGRTAWTLDLGQTVVWP